MIPFALLNQQMRHHFVHLMHIVLYGYRNHFAILYVKPTSEGKLIKIIHSLNIEICSGKLRSKIKYVIKFLPCQLKD